MILLWGVPGDGPIRKVRAALESRGEPTLLLDQFEASTFALEYDGEDPARGRLRIGQREFDLSSMRSIYLRPYETGRVLRAAGLEESANAIRFDEAMLQWIERSPALVVNRPSAMTSNGSKPFQAALIAEAGFAVAETLLTSDRQAAAAFVERHGSAIYKSMSGVRSKVSVVTEAVLDRLPDAACPLQIQEFIPGIDVRVHVLDGLTFACSITSGASDYRYPAALDASPTLAAMGLPKEIEARCVELTRALGLKFAGIDLRRSPAGRWVCFEANPSPGYTYYEESTGAPITDALASLLAAG